MLIFCLIMLLVFVIGAAFGSFLNVCIVRLPMEKSIVWPGSHCGQCFQPVAWYDNIPLVSYWLLDGKCRTCGATFSLRYFLIELLTAIGFVLLFWWTVVDNVNLIPGLNKPQIVLLGDVPLVGWIVFTHRAILFCLLLVASFCDLDGREIPLSITVPGAVIGLIFAVLFPWPWPYTGPVPPAKPAPILAFVNLPNGQQLPVFGPFDPPLPEGAQGMMPWPAWWPMPRSLPPHAWYTGLMTGIVGALGGTFLLRGIRFIFTSALGREALGLGDADLMMMAGAFVGWPIVSVAFFLAVFPAMVLGLTQMFLSGDRALPFGPSLALSILGTLLAWQWIGPMMEPICFSVPVVGMLIVVGGGFMVVAGLLLRLVGWLRRRPAT